MSYKGLFDTSTSYKSYRKKTDCRNNNNNLNKFYSINKIDIYLEHLKKDEINEVFQNLTTDETQKILYDLFKTKKKVGPCFHPIIELYTSIFKSIRYFYFLEGELRSQKTNCEKYKEDSIILNDLKKLKEYVEQQKLNLNQLTVLSIQAKKLNIKPEYVEYIKLYGPPDKLMFDPVLLQQIKDRIYK